MVLMRRVALSLVPLMLWCACEPTSQPSDAGADQTTAQAKPQAPTLDPTYARAAQALERGQVDEAFELCKPDEAGVVKPEDCHRVLGVIYKQRGDKPAACKSLQAYQRSPTARDLPSITRMIKNLGCAPSP